MSSERDVASALDLRPTVATTFVVTIAVAAASLYLIERPILRANAEPTERIAAAQTLRLGPSD